MRTIRVGSGAGFADDRIEPAAELAEHGQLDYLVFECLAERTIALAQRERRRDPRAGFNPWLAERMDAVLGHCARRGIRIVTNMGAANPLAAAEVVADVARRNGLPGLQVAAVTGDDVLDLVAGSDLPLLVSTNRDEIKAFEQLPGFTPADSGALLADIRRAGIDQPAEMLAAYRARYPHADLTELRSAFLSDAIYLVPANRLAEAQVAAGGKAYRAVFAADPFGPEAGTPHGMDIIYIFDLLDASNLGTPASHAVRDDLHRAWRGFAAAGDPGWPGYDPGATENTRLFGAPGGLTTEPPRDEVTAHWR